MTKLYGYYRIYDIATRYAYLANYVPKQLLDNKLNPWSEGHEMMQFPKKPFHKIYRQAMKELKEEQKKK